MIFVITVFLRREFDGMCIICMVAVGGFTISVAGNRVKAFGEGFVLVGGVGVFLGFGGLVVVMLGF